MLVGLAGASPHRRESPGVDDGLDLVGDLAAGVGPGDAGHQQAVIRGVEVAHGGDHGQGHGLGVESPPGRASADPAAAAGAGVAGDLLGPLGRTAREQLGDGPGEVSLELNVVVGPARLLPDLYARR